MELSELVLFERFNLNYVRTGHLTKPPHSMLVFFTFKEECSSLLYFLTLEKWACLIFLVFSDVYCKHMLICLVPLFS